MSHRGQHFCKIILYKGCSDINKVAGWGDSIVSWYYELFKPFKGLLEAAPWVMVRGNHEICSRAGLGFIFLLSPDDLADDYDMAPHDGEDEKAGTARRCPPHHSAHALEWANGLSVGHIDTSALKEITQQGETSIDHYNYKDGPNAHPSEAQQAAGEIVLELKGTDADNYNDNAAAKDEEKFYLESFATLGKSQPKDGMKIFITHTPVHAIVPDGKSGREQAG